ncbi:MAG TPA: NAD(P)H-binding protein [Anaeromyxobacteraceae bacterium]|nr:NAD(P)H-binding protein [Anaeromyxobacteraceae bacterium]
MSLHFDRITVLGATGPTGREIANLLASRGRRVRAVSRRRAALEAAFPGDAVERREGDALDARSLRSALEGCDLVVDCVGLPGDAMADHPRVARALAEAFRAAGARCVQVSSYWSFVPIAALPVRESSPRAGGPPWARFRREAEDVLREAGAAIVHLPDFFGPNVHTSTLQMPLREAAAGKPMSWIGGADVARDYLHVPDAMRIVADLASREDAYGKGWIVPGSGPITGAEVARLAGEILGRPVKLRAAAPWLLRLLGLFDRDLRGFLQLVPTYVSPLRFDGSRLDALLGPTPRTPYREALRATLASLRG